jgi:hypothetical protein
VLYVAHICQSLHSTLPSNVGTCKYIVNNSCFFGRVPCFAVYFPYETILPPASYGIVLLIPSILGYGRPQARRHMVVRYDGEDKFVNHGIHFSTDFRLMVPLSDALAKCKPRNDSDGTREAKQNSFQLFHRRCLVFAQSSKLLVKVNLAAGVICVRVERTRLSKNVRTASIKMHGRPS